MSSNYAKMNLGVHADAGANRPDHWMNIAHLPYFRYGTRREIEELLSSTLKQYIVRNCNDPSEFINGIPNPNLFVISFREKESVGPGVDSFYHIKFLRVPEKGLTMSNKVTESSRFFPSITEMIANSSVYYITPYQS